MRRGRSILDLHCSATGIAAMLLAACNNGGSGNHVASSTTVSGTASDGPPIANATVTLKDWNGNVLVTSTDAAGDYSFSSASLTPPLLMQVDDGAGKQYYGIAFGAGTSNLTLFSDLIVRDLCIAIDVPPDFLFGDPKSALPPSPEAVQLLEEMYRSTVASWLSAKGLDPFAFDLLETPFVANAPGFSEVLAMTNLVVGSLVIDDGTTKQTSHRVGGPPSWFEMQSNVDSPSGSSTSDLQSYFPASAQSPLVAALSGVNALLARIAGVVNARGGALTDADLIPFLSSNCLDDGMDRATFAAELATFLRTVRVTDMHVTRVFSWGDDGMSLDAQFELTSSQLGHTIRDAVRESFLQPSAGAPFLMIGNRRLANVGLHVEQVTQYYVAGPPDVFDSIVLDVVAPTGTLGLVTATSDDPGPIFSDTPLPFQATEVELFAPTPTTTLSYVQDRFETSSKLATLPPADMNVTVTVTPVEASPEFIVVAMGGATNESVVLLAPTEHSLVDAALGGQLAVRWKLPFTFAVRSIELTGECWTYGGTQRSSMNSDELLDATATLGHLSFPSSLLGSPIDGASLRLAIRGLHGEATVINYAFGDI